MTEAAALVNPSYSTIQKAVYHNELPAQRYGFKYYIFADDLCEFIKNYEYIKSKRREKRKYA